MMMFTPPHSWSLKTDAFGVNLSGTNLTPGIARRFKYSAKLIALNPRCADDLKRRISSTTN